MNYDISASERPCWEGHNRWPSLQLKEIIYIRALKPFLNIDGGRYNSPGSETIIKQRLTENGAGATTKGRGAGGGGWEG